MAVKNDKLGKLTSKLYCLLEVLHPLLELLQGFLNLLVLEQLGRDLLNYRLNGHCIF